jgi:hypothetical protein
MSGTIIPPDFTSYVTDQLLDEMISSGKWVEHGGDLEDQWAGGCFDHAIERTLPHLVGRPFDEVRHTPDFRQGLRLLLTRTAIEQRERLVSGCAYDGLGPLTQDGIIHRGVSGDVLDARLGVFWSQLRDQSLHRFVDEETGGFLLIARIGDVVIDWPATIRSRLDLANGQDEAEIRLVPGSAIIARTHRVRTIGGRTHVDDGVMLRTTA